MRVDRVWRARKNTANYGNLMSFAGRMSNRRSRLGGRLQPIAPRAFARAFVSKPESSNRR
jgi:hypothetical protein